MFDDWKKAWQQAIENFQRELSDDADGAPPQLASMRREVTAARKALDQLQVELERTREQVREEQQQEQVARRRGEMAERIADSETVRIAVEWASRHQERAAILGQKADALAAELRMREQDFRAMEEQYRQVAAQIAATPAGPSVPRPAPPKTDREKHDTDFRRLERDAREKAAQERLDELKKRMR
ncbi:MAG TPA: hypothetical protein VK864_07815 [Longimicrobiales bacterium]|nr:hypothetical protein [Longimicrobiales bacterium]